MVSRGGLTQPRTPQLVAKAGGHRPTRTSVPTVALFLVLLVGQVGLEPCSGMPTSLGVDLEWPEQKADRVTRSAPLIVRSVIVC